MTAVISTGINRDRLPLSAVNEIDLADTTAAAATRVAQVRLLMEGLWHLSLNNRGVSKQQIEAAFELVDDLRDDMIAILRVLGASEEEMDL